MLAVTVGLLCWQGWWVSHLPSFYTGDRYANGIIAVMLLLNHLTFAFPWSLRVRIILRITALLWLAFALFYVLGLTHIWFPVRSH